MFYCLNQNATRWNNLNRVLEHLLFGSMLLAWNWTKIWRVSTLNANNLTVQNQLKTVNQTKRLLISNTIWCHCKIQMASKIKIWSLFPQNTYLGQNLINLTPTTNTSLHNNTHALGMFTRKVKDAKKNNPKHYLKCGPFLASGIRNWSTWFTECDLIRSYLGCQWDK